MNYAIVDIETTGGFASGSGITEVAIRIHDGHTVIDQFDTLINPGRPIPLSIQSLTGIDDEMVRDSPPFADVASDIYQKLSGCIFIAHNVNFDYSFLKHHLGLAGYNFNAPKLCTVRLSRKIKPGLPSYSLGKLCDTLGIKIENRHRAGGDADATAILFSKLLAWDTEKHIKGMLKKNSGEQQLPPNLAREEFIKLPDCPGIYYFRDATGKEIYIGKAINIKKRVGQHFTGHNPNPQRQNFLRSIYSVTFETCGTELMALLLEAAEIKRLWPLYNRAMKRPEPKFALYAYEDGDGFTRLTIGKHGKYHDTIHVFDKEADGIRMLRKLVLDCKLNPDKCSYGRYPLFSPDTPELINLEQQAHWKDVDLYREIVTKSLAEFTENLSGFAILDTGRTPDEISCILVESGRLTGMGYVNKNADFENIKDIRKSLTPLSANHYMMQLIIHYAERNPSRVLLIKNPNTAAPSPQVYDQILVPASGIIS